MKQQKQYTFEELVKLCEDRKMRKLYKAHWKLFERKLELNKTTVGIIAIFIGPQIPLLISVLLMAESFDAFLFFLYMPIIFTLIGYIFTKFDHENITGSVELDILKITVVITVFITLYFLIITFIEGIPLELLATLWLGILLMMYISTCWALAIGFGVYLGNHRIYIPGLLHLNGIIIYTYLKAVSQNNVSNFTNLRKVLIKHYTKHINYLNIWCSRAYNSVITNSKLLKETNITSIVRNLEGFKKSFEGWFHKDFSNELRKSYRTQDMLSITINQISAAFKKEIFLIRESISQKILHKLGFDNWLSLITSVILFIFGIIIIPLIFSVLIP